MPVVCPPRSGFNMDNCYASCIAEDFLYSFVSTQIQCCVCEVVVVCLHSIYRHRQNASGMEEANELIAACEKNGAEAPSSRETERTRFVWSRHQWIRTTWMNWYKWMWGGDCGNSQSSANAFSSITIHKPNHIDAIECKIADSSCILIIIIIYAAAVPHCSTQSIILGHRSPFFSSFPSPYPLPFYVIVMLRIDALAYE